MKSGFRTRALRTVATLGAVAGAFAGLQAAPAAAVVPAVGTVQVVSGPVSANNSSSPKIAPPAVCPNGTKVLGGGGWALVNARTPDSERVVLSELRPFPSATGRDSFEASAFELSPGTNANWTIQSFAICAPPIQGMHLVVGHSTSSSDSIHQAFADCGSDSEAVVGVGSQIVGADGEATLVGEAVDTRLAFATAFEDADGFNGNWRLDVFAVCAPRPGNYGSSVGFSQLGSTSDPVQVAFARCGNGVSSKMLGIGATIINARPGTGLQVVFPGSQMEAAGVEATPTTAIWGPTEVQGICGD